jgi:hypothetical protein
MNDAEKFQLSCLFLQDKQRLIAAGKIQRWEVLKWAVTANIGLATISLAPPLIPARPALFLFCVFIAVVSLGLLCHYNRRITGARQAASKLMTQLSAEAIGELGYPAELADYDKLEFQLFNYAVGFSILPAFLIWVAG